MTGSAVHIAAEKLRERILEAFREISGVEACSLVVEGGVVRLSSGSSLSMSFAQIVQRAPVEFLETGSKGNCLVVRSEFNTSHMTYPYGIHLVVARVDRGLASVTLERMVVAYDVGRSINPLLVEGQIVGGVAQGIGGALLEEFVYDDEVQPLATSFMDYLIPTVTEIPNVEVIIREDAPSQTNPLGVKGAGEGGITGVGAAVANAIEDALDGTASVDCLPVSPSRIHNILKGKDKSVDYLSELSS
jgi:carbon-monoxide dehydrogenase large subunit/6-hydroxypseudooxynicotine dehydrogenase subunit gamma